MLKIKGIAKGEAAAVLSLAAAAFRRSQIEQDKQTALGQAFGVETKKPHYTQGEIGTAYAILMSGPKATPPRWKTIRRIIFQLRRGIDIEGRRIVRFDPETGKTLTFHPTKGLRNVA